MKYLTELDKHGYNFLIDELVWHLEKDDIPSSIMKIIDSDIPGYEFQFPFKENSFLEVDKGMIEEHWTEAISIMKQFDELKEIKMCS